MKKGFSLPLWVASAARAALKKLVGLSFQNYELIKIPNEEKRIKIDVHSASLIHGNNHALGISFAKSGLDLDLTQNLEIWTIVSLKKISKKNINERDLINLIAGQGVGIKSKTSEICISNFARDLLNENLLALIPEGFNLDVEIIFPNGKFLAERTSNKAFGVVDGLSIIGTSAETYSSASQDQLSNARQQLRQIIKKNFGGEIIFVIGENGFDLATSCNTNLPILKVGNWIGPLLVEAAMHDVKTVIMFGYHGKLIKLAGGIFHTHNHLADARIEILTYLAVMEKVPIKIIRKITEASTVEDAFKFLTSFSESKAENLWRKLSSTVEERSFKYINKYTKTNMEIAVILFDRQRQIRWFGNHGKKYFAYF